MGDADGSGVGNGLEQWTRGFVDFELLVSFATLRMLATLGSRRKIGCRHDAGVCQHRGGFHAKRRQRKICQLHVIGPNRLVHHASPDTQRHLASGHIRRTVSHGRVVTISMGAAARMPLEQRRRFRVLGSKFEIPPLKYLRFVDVDCSLDPHGCRTDDIPSPLGVKYE